MGDSWKVLLGLDVGTVRIGVASARHDVGIANPLTTIVNDDQVFTAIGAHMRAEQADGLVVGWPRGMDGQTTAQTGYVEQFVTKLKAELEGVTVYLQDEALTSRQAEAELQQRGKPFRKEDVDALAATFILQDFIEDAMTASSTDAQEASHV